MDFSFTPDQTLLKNSARAFLDEHCKIVHRAPAVGRSARRERGLWKEMAQLGWLGLALPRSTGAAASGWSRAPCCSTSSAAPPIPARTGRPCWPPPPSSRPAPTCRRSAGWRAIATGDARATVTLLDADLDWSPDAIATRAEKTATGWQLSGVKRYVAWAHVANVLLVPARTPEGVALFLVDPARPGVTVVAHDGHGPRHPLVRADARRRAGAAPTPCWATGRRRAPVLERCCAGPRSAPPPRCWARPAAASTWRRATPRCASSSASSSARSRPSATSAPRCCWRSRTRTPPSTTRRGRSTRGRRTRRWPRRSAKSYVGDAGAQGLRRRHPGARRHRLHLGVRPAHLLQARQGARGAVRRRGLPPRADRPARRRCMSRPRALPSAAARRRQGRRPHLATSPAPTAP